MTKRFLGWDCANKTLAWSYMDIDLHIVKKLLMITQDMETMFTEYLGVDMYSATKGAYRPDFIMMLHDPEIIERLGYMLDSMSYFLDNFINYVSAGVADILEGRKIYTVSEIDRTRALHKFLTTHGSVSSPSPGTQVIIEHQNKIGGVTNGQSTAVSHQLAFYYVEHNPTFVDPKLKNMMALRPDLTLERFIADEIPKHRNLRDAKYIAGKKHSKANFLYVLDVFGLSHMIDGISKSVLDDLADSFMEVFAYLCKNKLYIM